MLDRIAEFGQTSLMSRLVRKFIAVLIALWLPLFSSNMLAMPVYMSGSSTIAHTIVAGNDHAHASSQHHQVVATDHCAMHSESAGDHSQSDTGCKHSAACQLVVAAGRIEIALLELSEHPTPYFSSFQSQSVTPLDPPPLARV